MHTTIDGLAETEVETLARIKLAVTARLVSAAAMGDAGLAKLATARPFTLSLGCRGIPQVHIVSDGSRVKAYCGGDRPPESSSLTLYFGQAHRTAFILGGGKAMPLPLPRGPGALAALAFFREASARAPALLSDPATGAGFRARLLVEAAMAGLAETGSHDTSLVERMHHVPDGSVAVVVGSGGVEGFSLGLEKKGSVIRVLDEAPAAPNARLEFADAAGSIAVFTGKRPAVLALASGEVAIRGLLPLVQGLFAILDRLGEYLAVRIGEAGK